MDFKPGDIAACHGDDWTSRVIRWGTCSLFSPPGLRLGPSHVALICDWRKEMVWVESTTLCSRSCLLRGDRVSGAQVHQPIDRISDYLHHGGRVDIYRLSHFHRLSSQESHLLSRLVLNDFVRVNVRYDMGGALLSGTRVFQMTRLFPGANLDQLFCSELVAAVVMRLNRMNHANPSRFHPARLLRELVRTGKYRRYASIRPSGTLYYHAQGGDNA